MDFLLNDLVFAVDLYCSRRYSLHGAVVLRGCDRATLVELTGPVPEEFHGRGFEFEIPEQNRPPSEEDNKLAARFFYHQIGAVGTVKVEGFPAASEPIGPDEALRCCNVYVEWHSQNGHVVLDLKGVHLKPVKLMPPRKLADYNPEKGADMDPFKDQTFEIYSDEPKASSSAPEGEEQLASEKDNPYGLFPENLEEDLTEEEFDYDEIFGKPQGDHLDDVKNFERLVESSSGTAVRHLLTKLNLPDPEEWHSEKETENALVAALTEIAMFGVAFHICEHCDIRDAYRIFMREVADKCAYFPEMRGRSFVQNYSTSDYCVICSPDVELDDEEAE